jgi:hypothetical protein
MWPTIGLLIGMTLATPLAWAAGMFNPIGYLGVPPWRVPECTCHAGDGLGHVSPCERSRA